MGNQLDRSVYHLVIKSNNILSKLLAKSIFFNGQKTTYCKNYHNDQKNYHLHFYFIEIQWNNIIRKFDQINIQLSNIHFEIVYLPYYREKLGVAQTMANQQNTSDSCWETIAATPSFSKTRNYKCERIAPPPKIHKGTPLPKQSSHATYKCNGHQRRWSQNRKAKSAATDVTATKNLKILHEETENPGTYHVLSPQCCPSPNKCHYSALKY